MLSQQDAGKLLDGPGFLGSEATGAHNGFDLIERGGGECRRGFAKPKQGWRHLIDADIGALG